MTSIFGSGIIRVNKVRNKMPINITLIIGRIIRFDNMNKVGKVPNAAALIGYVIKFVDTDVATISVNLFLRLNAFKIGLLRIAIPSTAHIDS